MLKQLEIQSLRADLGSLSALLADRTAESDPIGYFQLSHRREQLEARLAEVQGLVQHKAAVALFFAGGPVIGSRGIEASFAGKTVDIFQDLVSKKFAAEEVGEIGRRGPVPMRANSDLLLTNLVRGSVGVLLEESDQNDAIADTQLKVVVDQVVDTISAAASQDVAEFDAVLEGMDSRYLGSLEQLFSLMDESRALLRVVESERDIEFGSEAIRRARERVSTARINENEADDFVGLIFILPTARRFELRQVDGEAPIVGTVSNAFARGDMERLISSGDVVGERWRVRIKTRTVTRPNRPPKITYTLLGLVERIPPRAI
jgi:hypothetical protein